MRVDYISDQGNERIRKITISTGNISTVAGNGTAGYAGDGGAATSANLDHPQGLKVTSNGDIYIAEGINHVIRKVTASTGNISTVAGNGTGHGTLSGGFSGDGGAATSAKLNEPTDVVFDGSGNIYIADYANNRVRLVTVSSGNISTVAGTGSSSYSGDGGAATSAGVGGPESVAVDGSGNLYIAARYDNRIRKVNGSGTISTFAGNGTAGYSGDGGSPSSAKLNSPSFVTLTGSGDLIITDGNNQRIREVSANCPANAGPDQTDEQDCCTAAWLGVTIGTPSVPNMSYSWSPGTSLNSTTIAQPTSVWSNTATAQPYTVQVSGTGCTTSTDVVSISAHHYTGQSCCKITGISTKTTTTENFVVYPNPSNSKITLALPATADFIRIVDFTGRMVFETKNVNESEFIIDVSKYSKGIYFISAKIGDILEKQKLLIE